MKSIIFFQQKCQLRHFAVHLSFLLYQSFYVCSIISTKQIKICIDERCTANCFSLVFNDFITFFNFWLPLGFSVIVVCIIIVIINVIVPQVSLFDGT